ncbi:MAG: sugar phosphate isomerase/epimerase [Kiritimatiellae bacterium]|jgi:sugar phosphate isomerase/epimerase|nr:sugar phosphate isomerase/epimerase [Kiritimatiellia bacterium]
MKNFSRRNFLRAGATAVVAAPVISQASMLIPGKRKPQVGVQMYSIREYCKKDLPGAFAGIKKIGYAGVEFAGYYGKSAKELRKMIDDNGLVACGTHTGIATLAPDKIQETIAFNKILGNKYLMVPHIGRPKTADECKKIAAHLSVAAVTAKVSGMYVGYHNHQHEFKDKYPCGKCMWEMIFDNASPLVCQQMDVGHVVAAGEDPVYWLNKYPNRVRTLHAKEVYPGPGILGQVPEGVKGVDWDALFVAVEKGVLDWYIVESEADPKTLDKIAGGFEFLKAKGRA